MRGAGIGRAAQDGLHRVLIEVACCVDEQSRASSISGGSGVTGLALIGGVLVGRTAIARLQSVRRGQHGAQDAGVVGDVFHCRGHGEFEPWSRVDGLEMVAWSSLLVRTTTLQGSNAPISIRRPGRGWRGPGRTRPGST